MFLSLVDLAFLFWWRLSVEFPLHPLTNLVKIPETKPRGDLKMATQNKRLLSVELDLQTIARLDKLAEKCGISRHQMMKNFIESCTAEGEFLSKIGVIYTAKKMMNFLEIGKEAFQEDARQEKLAL